MKKEKDEKKVGGISRRNTFQRRLILSAIERLDHPTAQQVLDEVSKYHVRMSLGTVYRNLKLLTEEGKLARLSLPDSPERFDGGLRRHDHIVCEKCGKIVDMEGEYREELDSQASLASGFVIKSHRIEYTGICSACREREAEGMKT